MKAKSLFIISWLSAVFLMACSPSRYSMTPTEEIKKSTSISKTDHLPGLLAGSAFIDSLIRRNDEYLIRIIYTEINRNEAGSPAFTHYYFNPAPDEYFYPASTVKMPAAFLSLQKLNELNRPGLDMNATMITESGHSSQPAVFNDPTAEDGRPTIAHYIKKIFLTSDNDAFNRLYEFLGQEYMNKALAGMGYDSVQILHRLSVALSEEQNRQTNPVNFYDTSANLVYQQPLTRSNLAYQFRDTRMGKGYYSGGKLVNQPFDFSQKNRVSLPDLHSMLMSVIFPASVAKEKRFNLTTSDYRFLYKCMSMLPRESFYPQYNASVPDAYVKFLLFGGSGRIEDPEIRIFNKPGDAYGFLTDVAYITDMKNGVEFFLSASIYCNSDGIFNDDKYDYATIGFPFMKELGRLVYEHERKRKKQHLPDFSVMREAIR